ncbi:hypothetical protein BC829DRAFT_116725 [Chytridium lagenaria]|nr:hypothetical protein BC829DRAFT_116725 [Chytridium lagenaria]
MLVNVVLQFHALSHHYCFSVKVPFSHFIGDACSNDTVCYGNACMPGKGRVKLPYITLSASFSFFVSSMARSIVQKARQTCACHTPQHKNVIEAPSSVAAHANPIQMNAFTRIRLTPSWRRSQCSVRGVGSILVIHIQGIHLTRHPVAPTIRP